MLLTPVVHADLLTPPASAPGSTLADDGSGILPVEEAFRVGIIPGDAGVEVFWQVAPGHFLYRDKFSVLADGVEQPVELRQGVYIDDETFGYVEVLDGLVSIRVTGEAESVSVHYQGCAAQGFCYPPQKIQVIEEKLPVTSVKNQL